MGFWGCSGISWTICKQSAPHSRQITTRTPHQLIFKGRMLFLTTNQQCQSTECADLVQSGCRKKQENMTRTSRCFVGQSWCCVWELTKPSRATDTVAAFCSQTKHRHCPTSTHFHTYFKIPKEIFENNCNRFSPAGHYVHDVALVCLCHSVLEKRAKNPICS